MQDIGLLYIIVAFAIYFIPSIVARQRKHHQTMAITVLNISAGALIVLLLVVALFFVPTAASDRLATLIALNIFEGVTLVGWIVALVWACTVVQKQPAT